MLYYKRVNTSALKEIPTVIDILKSTAADGSERIFLTCEGTFEKILNLLWPKTLWSTLQSCFPRMRRPSVGFDSGTIMLALAKSPMGGEMLTDVLGKYAYKNEYNGIRFPSARALDASRSRPWTGGSLKDGLRFGGRGDESFEFDDLMNEIHSHATNVVLFRGSYILQSVKRFSIQTAQGDSQWYDNELYGAPEQEIEREIVAAGGWCAEDMYSECSDFISDPEIRFDRKS